MYGYLFRIYFFVCFFFENLSFKKDFVVCDKYDYVSKCELMWWILVCLIVYMD